MKNLLPQQIDQELVKLNGWYTSGNAIQKQFNFKDFNETFSFMCRVALLAEKLNHHPDWSGGYNNINIQLSTHIAGGITEKDIDMASKIDSFSS